MPGLAVEILFVLLLLVANGVFALAELAVMSARKPRLQQRAEEGDARARAALELAAQPDEFLSTVQVGITLVGVLTGAFSGATLAEALAIRLKQVQGLAPYSEAIALAAVVVVTTYLSLIIGELVPKRLALNNPERIAAAVAGPMRGLSQFAAPVVWLLTASTDLIVRLMRIRPSGEPPVTEEELKVLLEQGTHAGVFAAGEQEMVEGVFRLADLRVGALATPRRDAAWLDLLDSPEGIRRALAEKRHAVYPVCEGGPDHVAGIVSAHDLLARCLQAEPFDLRACLQPPLFVPETLRAAQLLERFRETGIHIAVVVDEHGGTHGVVTLTDVLEAIVGELPLEGEPREPQIVEREDGSWLLDGLVRNDELKERLSLRELPEEESGAYETLGGMVATHLGKIPTTGDHFEWSGFRFEVVDMDGLRVDKVLVSRIR